MNSYKDDHDLENAKLWVNEAYKYIETHDNKNDNDEVYFAIVDAAWEYRDIIQNIFCLNELVEKLVKEDKIFPYLWHIRETWGDVLADKDITKWENGILEIKQKIEANGNQGK